MKWNDYVTDAETGPKIGGQVEFVRRTPCDVSEAPCLECLLGAKEESKPA